MRSGVLDDDAVGPGDGGAVVSAISAVCIAGCSAFAGSLEEEEEEA